MASIKEKKDFIWYCPNCGKSFCNLNLSISDKPLVDFYRKCKNCGKYFDIDNKEIKLNE